MDTTPTRPRQGPHWTSNPHQTLPNDLAEALRGMRGRGGRLGAALAACRDADWGVPSLAAAVAMKPAAVAQQILRARKAGDVGLPGVAIPRPPVPALQHPDSTNWEGPELPAGCAEHLREVYAAIDGRVRAYLPDDHPRRLAARHLAADIRQLRDAGIRRARIGAALGISRQGVDVFVQRHGVHPDAGCNQYAQHRP